MIKNKNIGIRGLLTRSELHLVCAHVAPFYFNLKSKQDEQKIKFN